MPGKLSMPSNRPILPSLYTQHKFNRPHSKKGNPEPLRMPQTAMWLLQRCIFVLQPWKNQTPRYGSRQISQQNGTFSKISLTDCNAAFIIFFQRGSIHFPNRRRRSLFVFCFPQNMERSVTPPSLETERPTFPADTSGNKAQLCPFLFRIRFCSVGIATLHYLFFPSVANCNAAFETPAKQKRAARKTTLHTALSSVYLWNTATSTCQHFYFDYSGTRPDC